MHEKLLSIKKVMNNFPTRSVQIQVQTSQNTVKPLKVVTSINQATCIKQTWVQFPKQTKPSCIKQTSVLSKQILIIPWMLA